MDGTASALEDVYADDLCVAQFLWPLRRFLDEDEVTEVCINEPGYVHIESSTGWRRVESPEMTFDRCMALATAVATFGEQSVSEAAPLLSTTLPTGERIQIVIPPVARRLRVCITIRKPSGRLYTLEELDALGMFSRLAPQEDGQRPDPRLLPRDKALLGLRR